MMGNCVGQKNRPSRQLEVPEEGFGEVIKLISSPTHSLGGIGLPLGFLLTVCRATVLLYVTIVSMTLYHIYCVLNPLYWYFFVNRLDLSITSNCICKLSTYKSTQ